MLAEIKVELLRLPSYGYRRIHGRLQRRRPESGAPPVNQKRIYRVMEAHDLLFTEPESYRPSPVHDGRIMTEASNRSRTPRAYYKASARGSTTTTKIIRTRHSNGTRHASPGGGSEVRS